MKRITIPYYSDPGHGWVKVNKSVLKDLGISDKITPYSYQRKEFVYLEEDYDAGILIEALKIAGIIFKIKPISNANRYSKIRNYETYRI